MGISEAMEFTLLSKGHVIAHHLQAISHCPVTLAQLAAAARSAGLAQRLYIPQDGDNLQ